MQAKYTFAFGHFITAVTVVLSKAYTVLNHERTKDDGLLLFSPSKLGIISSKQHRGHVGNLLQ